jgi:hypothetical protein
MPDDSATRMCRSCFHEKPLDQFRRRRDGDDSHRETNCRECHNTKEQLRRYKAHTELHQAAMRQLANARNEAEIRVGICVLLDAVGGVTGLMERFRAEWEASPPGSQQRWWYTKAVLKLVNYRL